MRKRYIYIYHRYGKLYQSSYHNLEDAMKRAFWDSQWGLAWGEKIIDTVSNEEYFAHPVVNTAGERRDFYFFWQRKGWIQEDDVPIDIRQCEDVCWDRVRVGGNFIESLPNE